MSFKVIANMKILVISDSHGKAERLKMIVDQVAADHVIHCGDFCTKKSLLPKGSQTVVQGNCDIERLSLEEIWEAKGFRFFITHGHRYDVKTSVLPIRYRGQEVGAQIVCFGHSHVPYCEQSDGILLINPGSIAQPRGFTVPTYACLELMKKKIKVTYYGIDGQPIQQLGGIYTFQ